MKYTEIFKLRKLLDEKKIPYDFITREVLGKQGYQICYPCSSSNGTCVCSIIENLASNGNGQDLLEIMGLLTPDEETYDLDTEDNNVLGYLTAENVFKRIAKHYEAFKK